MSLPGLERSVQSRKEKREVPIRLPLTNCWGKTRGNYTEGVVIIPKSPEWGLPTPLQGSLI